MRSATISDYLLPDGTIPVLLSADTPDLLRDEAAAILSYVTDRPEVAPHRVAEMLFRTRVARRHRAVAMVTGRDDLATALRAVAEGAAHPAVVRNAGAATPRKRAFVFPGQGGQRPGMGKLYYEHSPAFRAEADRCDEIFHELFGESPLTYVLDEDFPADDSARIVQPALFLQMAAFAAMWRAAGIEPGVTIGHSQGEIAAAYVSGKMTLADAILVVGTRAHAVDEIASDDYAMAVVAADRDECEDLLARRSGWSQLSVVNAPHMVGISGDRGTVQDVVDTLTERGTFARVIRVRYPAHTSAINRLGDDVREAVRSRLSSRHFHETKIECIGATLGRPITSDLPVDEYWFWNLRNVVRFDKAIAAAVAQQVDTFVELAEHPTLQLSIQENLSVVAAEHNTTVTGTSSRTATDLSEFARNLAVLATSDADYSWDRLRTGSEKTIPLPLPDFPNVRMNELRLWLPYNSPSAVRAGPVTPPAEHAAASSVTEHVPGNLADAVAPAQLLVEDWVRLVRRSLVPPRRLGLIDHTGACAELASTLCAEAENYGATARMIDIENDDDSGDVDTVVVLLADPGPLDDYDAVARTADFFGLRSWWPGLGSEVTDCWLLTAGGETVVAEDAPPHPVHAAASAGFRCIGAEYPGVAFRHLDLSPEQSRPDAAGAIIAAIHTAGEPELAVRGDSLYAKRLVEAERMTPDSAATAPENVVIIGGTGNLGLEFCDHFSRHGARRITLVGRSGETAATADRLARIRRTGAADIRTIRCDVRDKSAVARMAEELRATPADLIIHAAVDYSDIELAQITSEKADQALRTKVLGIAQVLEVLPRAENCRVLLCSSMAATIGGRGQVVYAAANRMLDAMAHRLRAEGLDCVSVQWGQWTVHLDLGAAGAAKLAGAGVVPMDPADAIALGSNGIRTNAIVAAFDWSRARSALEAYGYGPLLSQLAATPADADHAPDGGEDLPRRMVKLLAEVIGVDRVGTIDTSVPMVAIGLDSLQALEFRRRVNGEFGHDLPVAQLLGGASVDDVVALVRSHPPIPARTGTPARPSSSPRPDVPAESVRPAQATKPVDITERARLAAAQAVPADLDHDRMRSARADLDTFGLRAMMETLDPVLRDGAVHTADEIATRLEFAPRHRWLLQRWLDELTTHGYLDQAPAHGYRAAGPVPTPARPDLLTVCADLGYSPEFATFLQRSDEHLTELAQDRVRVQELLFPDGDMLTAEAAYRDNIISSYLNTAARETVAGIAERLERDRSPIRILELGAGIGGTTNDVLAGLSGLSVDYHFTDLSTFFLAAAQKRFAEYPWIRYGIMDLNTDLGEQPPYDIVIAANVVHNAHHIGKTLRQLHDLLNPGGAVVFIEACRANFQLLTSMKFLMSAGPGQPHPGSSDIRAGARIFLTEDEWRDQLSESGFTPMLVLPDADHPMYMLDQRIFAAVRD